MPFNSPDPLPTTKSPTLYGSSSPFARTPVLSPSSSRRSSPARRPLHERSSSHSNQHSITSPTIRVVEEEPAGIEIYSKTPFPNQPSQILPPRNAPGYKFESRGTRVSDSSIVAKVVSSFEREPSQTLVPKPLQPKRTVRHSTSTSNSDADTLLGDSPFSPSSSRFSQGTTPAASPAPTFEKETDLYVVEEQPAPEIRPTIRAVPPSSSSDKSTLQGPQEPSGHALTPRASAASLASTESSESLEHLLVHDRESSATPQPSPEGHQRSPSAGSDDKKQASSTNKVPEGPVLKASIESLPYSDISYESSANIQVHYPVVRQPSASLLWAESHVLPKNPARMNNRAAQVHQWSSALSTIASESERGSRSIDRRSQSVDYKSVSQNEDIDRTELTPRRRTITSHTSSENLSSESAESSVPVPLPLFSPITKPLSRRSEEKEGSDEHHDTISPLQSPPIRQKRSGFLRRHDSDRSISSRPGSETPSRPGSSQSDLSTFIASTIPAWARVYYRRGERASLVVPETSTEASESVRVPTANTNPTNSPSEANFPSSLWRPRTRPHQREVSNPHTDTTAEEEGPVEQEAYVIAPPRRPISELFTPRLREDRRSTARLSAWKSPSIDVTVESLFFSRHNRQILMFCLGFLCPLAWIVASFLPLPPDPALVDATPSELDLERQFDRRVGPTIEDRSYTKAIWWRNLNRVMSAVGTLLIGAIIALGVVASKMP